MRSGDPTAARRDETPLLLPLRRALADDVYDALLGLLMDQVIEPGERVSIDGLARRLGVSPTPVREALARLEPEGLVIKQPLKGYIAAPVLDEAGLADLFQVRRLLEPAATAQAIERMTPDRLAVMETLIAEMHHTGEESDRGADRFEDYREFMRQDAEFHRLIAEQSGNSLLADAITRLRAQVHNYRLYFRHGIAGETAGEHAAILDAVRAGDPDAGRAAMESHIRNSYTRIDTWLRETHDPRRIP